MGGGHRRQFRITSAFILEIRMTSKYLYGKKQFLMPLVERFTSPRFSDLSHYSRLENEKMRDDEMSKRFVVDRGAAIIQINNHIIAPSSLAADPEFSLPAQHCYCLCLTSRRNDPELFEVFKADICIEIDVDVLIEVLEKVCLKDLVGATVDAREITYYDLKQPPRSTVAKDLVFIKPSFFSHECEFRVAIFYPKKKRGFLTTSGKTVPFFIPGESMHLHFEHPNSPIGENFIVATFEPARKR